MMVEDVLKIVGQYGLPLVLFVVLAIAYDRKEKEHKADRERWEEERREERERVETERRAERERWAEERRKLQEAWDEERREWFNQTKADGENLARTLLDTHKTHAAIISAANDMSNAFLNEKKEIREARERELRDTGQHRPPRLPR
jgi:hypothetical protein